MQGLPIDESYQGFDETYKSSLVFNKQIPLPESVNSSSSYAKYAPARIDGDKFNGWVQVRSHTHYDVFAKWSEGDVLLDIKIFLHTENNGSNHKKWVWNNTDGHTIHIDLYNVLNLY